MTRFWMVRKGKFIVLAVAAFAALGLLVMGLWNWLMPGIFGLSEIGFLQAVGLLVLSRILFVGFRRPGGPGMAWRQRMKERWVQMTPVEREKFRSGFRAHCGPRHQPAEAQSAAE